MYTRHQYVWGGWRQWEIFILSKKKKSLFHFRAGAKEQARHATIWRVFQKIRSIFPAKQFKDHISQTKSIWLKKVVMWWCRHPPPIWVILFCQQVLVRVEESILNKLSHKNILLRWLTPCWSVLDFWKINLEKSSSTNWIFTACVKPNYFKKQRSSSSFFLT